MAFLNKQKFAERVGRSPRQIIRYCADGILPEDSKGRIDLDHPLTVEFLRAMAEGRSPGNPNRGSTNPSGHNLDPDRLSLDLSNEANLESLRIQAEINLKTEQALAVKTKRAQMLSVLVPKITVDQKIGALVEHINSNVITLPRRGVARTLATVQRHLTDQGVSVDTRQLKIELETLWKELVSQALLRAKAGETIPEMSAPDPEIPDFGTKPPPKKSKAQTKGGKHAPKKTIKK